MKDAAAAVGGRAGLPRREVYARALRLARGAALMTRRPQAARGGAPIASACAPRRSPPMLLRLKGYRVLARRFAAAGGEIDLVVRRGDTIAFVEVKARDDLDAAASADHRRQAPPHRPRRAGSGWRATPGRPSATLRGDAVFRRPPDAFPATSPQRIGWTSIDGGMNAPCR